MLIQPQQMIATESAWIEKGGDAGELMDIAGDGIARAISSFFPEQGARGTMVLALGPGNNAGDACVAAQLFAERGWIIRWFRAISSSPFSKLTQSKLDALATAEELVLGPKEDLPDSLPRPLVVLDGLLGVGARPTLDGEMAEAATKINRWRTQQGAFTVAMDIPTGLNGETGVPDKQAVVADLTAAVGAAKSGMVADQACNSVGRLALIPLPQLDLETDESERVFSPADFSDGPAPSPHDTHKNTVGRVLIIAGSPGMTGAASLTALAALRTGAGMVTVLTDPACVTEVALRSSPEVMVRPIPSDEEIPWSRYDALCIGPGLGNQWNELILQHLSDAPIPAVIDADALNAIAAANETTQQSLLAQATAPRLVTPHHGELRRLLEGADDLPSRRATAHAFVEKFPAATLLYKGARTIICQQDEQSPKISYNSSGHSGMASAGMGDTLTGICGALLARGIASHHAASAGAWLHGRAAEFASYHTHLRRSTDSLLASDVIDNIGAALIDLREHRP